jgi:hypothetical protein
MSVQTLHPLIWLARDIEAVADAGSLAGLIIDDLPA